MWLHVKARITSKYIDTPISQITITPIITYVYNNVCQYLLSVFFFQKNTKFSLNKYIYSLTNKEILNTVYSRYGFISWLSSKWITIVYIQILLYLKHENNNMNYNCLINMITADDAKWHQLTSFVYYTEWPQLMSSTLLLNALQFGKSYNN